MARSFHDNGWFQTFPKGRRGYRTMLYIVLQYSELMPSVFTFLLRTCHYVSYTDRCTVVQLPYVRWHWPCLMGKRERSLFEPGPSQKQQTGLSQGKKGSKQKSRKAEKQALAVSHFAFLLFCFSALTLFSPVTNLFVASDLVRSVMGTQAGLLQLGYILCWGGKREKERGASLSLDQVSFHMYVGIGRVSFCFSAFLLFCFDPFFPCDKPV
jgi:hypothetical protein